MLLIAALAAAALALKRRPVKPPQGSGIWEPANLDRSTKHQ
jgi:hypothetical protein